MAGGPVSLVVEGVLDAAVAKRVLREADLVPGPEYIQYGKAGLDQRLAGFNNAARFSCWLVVRDLDRDAPCAPELRQRLLPAPAPHMRFQVSVRAVEAWLLADMEGISDLISVGRAKVSRDPDSLDDPKRHLLDLARQSRRRAVREAMLPERGSSARIGPGYTATLIDYATNRWRPEVAADRSMQGGRYPEGTSPPARPVRSPGESRRVGSDAVDRHRSSPAGIPS